MRLQPTVVQNVVTYIAVIDVPNPQLKLKPGMTANVTIEIARRENALRVPNTSLRFRPTSEMFTALNQPVPPELTPGQRGARGGATGASHDNQPGGAGHRQTERGARTGAAAPGQPGGRHTARVQQTDSRRRVPRSARRRRRMDGR